MPDPLDFDGARRALDDVPAPDLWADASQRAEAGAVVPLPAASGDRARRPRWLVAVGVAAVAVLAVGTAAALLADDDQSVDTTPVTEPPSGTEDVAVYQADGADCALGVAGEPLPATTAVSPAESFGPDNQGTLVTGSLNATQGFAVQVPGQVVTDLLGERVEDVQLERGTGQIWFQGGDGDPVQVRWFTGEEMCESFTVTVGGGSEDGNRHAAVALAERVRLRSELGDPGDLASADLEGTGWWLERSIVGGVPTDGNGLTFAFEDGEAAWTDGCNSFGARFTQPSATELELGDISSTEMACPTNPTSQAVTGVMSSGAIEVARGSGVDSLILSAGDATLVLRPIEPGSGPATTTTISGDQAAGRELAGTEWRVAALYRGDEEVSPRADAGELTFSFSDTELSWGDGCNSLQAGYAVDPGGFLTIGTPLTTLVGCGPSETTAVISAVMGADRIYLDEMGGVLELSDTEGNHIALEPA